MIQRIQSIFLILAAGTVFGQFAVPYASADSGNPALALPALADGALNPFDNVGLLGLSLLSGVLSLAAVFLFRNRSLQARLALLSLLACIMLVVLAVLVCKQTLDALPEGMQVQYGAGLALPPLAALLTSLSARDIPKA